MNLYLLRHGETDYNRRKALQGQLDKPLNETGRQQAREARRQLAGIQFDRVYVSPLHRARDTAMLATGLSEDQLTIEPQIIEINFGVWEGHNTDSLGAAFAPFFADPTAYHPPEGGESLEHLIQRVGGFLDRVSREYAGDHTILAVSHGAAIHAMITAALGTPLSQFWAESVGNCGFVVLHHDGERWTLAQHCLSRDKYYG